MERIDLSNLGISDVHGHPVGVVDSFYLNARELSLLGTQKVCGKCGHPFVRGEEELKAAHYAEKGGKPKVNVELFNGAEIIDVNLKKNHFGGASMKQEAVLFGLQGFNVHICPSCSAGNKEVHYAEAFVSGSGKRARIADED